MIKSLLRPNNSVRYVARYILRKSSTQLMSLSMSEKRKIWANP